MSTSTPLMVSQKLFAMPLGASVITDALSAHGVTPSLYEGYKQRLFGDAKEGASVCADHKLMIKMLEDQVQSEYTPAVLKQYQDKHEASSQALFEKFESLIKASLEKEIELKKEGKRDEASLAELQIVAENRRLML